MWYLIIALILFLCFFFLYKREKRRLRNGVVLFSSIVFAYYGIAEISYVNHWQTLYEIMLWLTYAIIPLIVLLFCVLLVIDTMVLLKREGKRIKNLLPLGVAILILAGTAAMVYLIISYNGNPVILACCTFGAILLAYFSIVFLCFLIYNFVYSATPKEAKADYIVIHGCGLKGGDKVTPLLASRVEKAMELYHLSKEQALLIPSGGQGADEIMSEAKAMCNYMISAGIPRSSILMEDKSTTTKENLIFAKAMIDQRQNGIPYECYFVTSNYHVLRTSLLAKKVGMKGEGVGAKTKWYYWITAFLREYIAIVVQFKWIMIAIMMIALALVASSYLHI